MDQAIKVLTVGSWDPLARTGVLCDMQVFAAFGIYGTAVVPTFRRRQSADAVEATEGVGGAVSDQMEESLRAGPAAIKLAWIDSSSALREVLGPLSDRRSEHVVFDGLAFDTHVTEGAGDEVVGLVKARVLPIAEIAILDIRSAERLAGIRIRNSMGMRAAAKVVNRVGVQNVLVTSDGLPDVEVGDVLFDGQEYAQFPSTLSEDEGQSASSTSYAAAIACGLARGRGAAESIAIARMFLDESARNALAVTKDIVVPNNLYGWWSTGGSRGYGA